MLINKKYYKVNENEFKPYTIPEFPKLNLLHDLTFCEILVGLLSDIAEIDNDFELICDNTKYGGFIGMNVRNFNKISHHDKPTYIIRNNKNNIILSENILSELIPQNLNPNAHNCVSTQNKDGCAHHNYYIPKLNMYIYLPNNMINHFHYYIDNDIFNYDNLINLVMIVKNAGDNFANILKENINLFDRYTILDTGSTDNTINIIKDVLKNKKGELYEEPFINFRESRNRSLELAGHKCKFNIILDDTYIVRGKIREFLNMVRSDQLSDSFSIYIKSHDMIYCSNRIIKSETNLRYIYKIHEVISNENNMNIMIPYDFGMIDDYKDDYMEGRTSARKQLDIKLLNEMIIEDPENPRHYYYLANTYKMIKDYQKAADNFLKRIYHKNEGFKSELIDACFELGRLYNFELKKPWDECMKYYMMSYELDKERPDSLFFIGLHYYSNGDIVKSYDYFKQAFNLGFPIEKQYSLKPTLSFQYLPELIIPLAFNNKDFNLGIEACNRYMNNNPPNKIINDWYKIFEQIIVLPPLVKPIITDKKIICFIADGGYSEWSGKNIEKGLGGSEKYIVMMAENMKKMTGLNVIVFCNTIETVLYNDVMYIPLNQLYQTITSYYIDICIISRYSHYIPLVTNSYVEKIYVVVHDLILSGDVIINSPKLKNIICLTNWHKEYFINHYPDMKDKTIVIGNGIMPIKINKKQPFKFIYSSFANRGLLPLLEMWNDILNINNNAELHCYCDLENKWLIDNHNETIIKIKQLLPLKNVFMHGWVEKDRLEEAWSTSSIWLYPCTFMETFCITALEAAISKTLVITNDLAGLNDTVGDRGIIITGDPTTNEWKNNALLVLRNLNNINIDILLEANYEYAINNTWDKVAQKTLDLFNIDNNDARDTFIWFNQMRGLTNF
jgi:glycosyltransferase involved in cell wall biosynthesis